MIMIGLYTILRKEVTRFIRIWTQTLLPSVINITLYFMVFGSFMGNRIGTLHEFRYIDYIVPGLIMMSVITSSYTNVVFSFFSAKFQRNIEEMLVAPLPNYIILWGFVLGGITRSLVTGVLVSITALFFTKLQIAHVFVTIGVSVITAVLFSLAGFINAIFSRNFDDVNIVPTFVLNPLIYLGGVFYSVDVLPEFWQKITYLNPIFYLVNAFRYGLLGYSDVKVSFAFSLMVGLVILLYLICLYLLRKGIGIKT
jgi:ABC-2 type transport system permease protein